MRSRRLLARVSLPVGLVVCLHSRISQVRIWSSAIAYQAIVLSITLVVFVTKFETGHQFKLKLRRVRKLFTSSNPLTHKTISNFTLRSTFRVLVFINKKIRTSAVSSTNYGSILIFASCVVGTCNILYGEFFIGRGPICMFCFSPLSWLGPRLTNTTENRNSIFFFFHEKFTKNSTLLLI